MKLYVLILFFCLIQVSSFMASSNSSSSSSGSSSSSSSAKGSAAKKAEEVQSSDEGYKFNSGQRIPVDGLAIFKEQCTKSNIWDKNYEGMILDFLDNFTDEPAYAIHTNFGCIYAVEGSENGEELFCMGSPCGSIEVRHKGKDGIFPDRPTYTIHSRDNIHNRSLAVSADGQLLFILKEQNIEVRAKKDNRFTDDAPLYTLKNRDHGYAYDSFEVSEDGQQLIVLQRLLRSRGKVIDVYTKGIRGRFSDIPTYTLAPISDFTQEIALSADGKWLFSVLQSGIIEVREKQKDGRFSNVPTYSIDTLLDTRYLKQRIAVSKDGRQLFCAGFDKENNLKIQVREKKENGQFSNVPKYEINMPRGSFFGIALSRDGQYLFSINDYNIEVRINQREQLLRTNDEQRARLRRDEWRKDELRKRRKMKIVSYKACSEWQAEVDNTSKGLESMLQNFILLEGAHRYNNAVAPGMFESKYQIEDVTLKEIWQNITR